MEFRFEFGAKGIRLRKQLCEIGSGSFFEGDFENTCAEFLTHLGAAGKVTRKRIDSFVIPTRENFQRRTCDVRNVNFYVFGLANAIEAANTLLKEFGVDWQIE